MKEYIFNEQEYIERMISAGYVDENNPTYTIKYIARYNHYVLGLDKKQSYNDINEYMKHNCSIYTEIGYQSSIKGCIRDVKKRPWANISRIIITQQELERIRALNDERKEKLAFVLLADVKYDNACRGEKTNVSWLSISDLYRFARVTMPIKDRALFLSFLYEDNLVEENFNPKFSGKKLLYVSPTDENNGLTLNELNYKELAFTYMNWKHGGYKECESCGRLIKIRKNTKYCKDCTPVYEKLGLKTVNCSDCGAAIVVDPKDTKTCRCEECQRAATQENWKRASQKYRDSVKSS